MKKLSKLLTILVMIFVCSLTAFTVGCNGFVDIDQLEHDKKEWVNVVFANEDGTILQSGEVEKGTVPVYEGEIPTKEGGEHYSWEFAGWNEELAEVEISKVYIATFEKVIFKYLIKFVNEDGTLLQEGQVEYGTMPVYEGETPEKAATAQYSYTFAGWDKSISNVEGETTYTATFESTINKYLVKFVNEDGTLLQEGQVEYGTMPVYEGVTPEKAATAQYSYTFAGWDKSISNVEGETTYTATFESTINKYLVKFVNEDGAVLQEGQVEYGVMPVYEGVTPEKAATAQYTYTFAGWGEISEVTGDVVYTATFNYVLNKYLVKFVNEDGEVLQSSEIEYGVTPVYEQDKPVKANDDKYSYVFAGWDKEIVDVIGEVVYTATFNKAPLLDGSIDSEFYGNKYMKYSAGKFADKGGYADIYVYTYEASDAVYLSINVVGPTKIANDKGGIMFMVHNNNWLANVAHKNGDETGCWDGKYYRAFGNGTARYSTLQTMAEKNNHWTGMTAAGSVIDNMEAIYEGQGVGGYYSNFTLEWRIGFAEYGAEKAEDLSFVLGWINQSGAQFVYTTENKCVQIDSGNADKGYLSQAIATDKDELYWWNLSAIEARKEVDAQEIRLDGALDAAYTNTFTYTAITGIDNEKTITKFYWYEGKDALYMAFDVTAGKDRTIQNIGNDFGGSAAINFAIAGPNNPDGTLNGRWFRATGAQSRYKALEAIKTSTTLYGTTLARLDYIRGSEEGVRDAGKRNVQSFLIEVKINYADYGATSADDLKILIGGSQNSYAGDWFYSKDGTSFAFPNATGTAGGAYLRLQDVNNEAYQFWWTIADFEAYSASEKHPVYFTDETGKILQYSEVKEGATPIYNGTIPSKAGDAQYTYEFAGWDKELAPVTGETTYVASYSAHLNKYNVKFVNEDGTVLQEGLVEYGGLPVYNGVTPEKEGTAQYSYIFKGWDKEIVAVTGEVVYTAEFKPEGNFYIVKFVNDNGEILQEDELAYGAIPEYINDTPIKVSDDKYSYLFKGWDKEIVAVTGEVVYTATYEKLPLLDGVIDSEFYGDTYMHYSAGAVTDKNGYAEIYVYSYVASDAVYLSINVVGPTKIDNAKGGIMFMVHNNNWLANVAHKNGDETGCWDGKYYRAFGNGTARYSTLQTMAEKNNHWTGMTAAGSVVDNMKAIYQGNASDGYYSDFTLEWRIGFAEYGAEKAEDLAFVFGWINQGGAQFVYTRENKCVQIDSGNADSGYLSQAIATDKSELYWWSLSSLNARKQADTKAIRLDGLVDSKYTNMFTYSMVTGTDNESTVTKFYWYEAEDALYMAFDVTASLDRTLKNTGSGSQGSAAVNFAVTKTGTMDGWWFRAWPYATQKKLISKISTDTNFYGTTFVAVPNMIRGSEGSLRNTTRNIKKYVIEVKIVYADYGVTSADELSIMIGGKQKGSEGDTFYGKDGEAFLMTNTGATGGGYLRVQDVNNEAYQFWWTVADFETEMAKQAKA